jgi:hypothetical protein
MRISEKMADLLNILTLLESTFKDTCVLCIKLVQEEEYTITTKIVQLIQSSYILCVSLRAVKIGFFDFFINENKLKIEGQSGGSGLLTALLLTILLLSKQISGTPMTENKQVSSTMVTKQKYHEYPVLDTVFDFGFFDVPTEYGKKVNKLFKTAKSEVDQSISDITSVCATAMSYTKISAERATTYSKSGNPVITKPSQFSQEFKELLCEDFGKYLFPVDFNLKTGILQIPITTIQLDDMIQIMTEILREFDSEMKNTIPTKEYSNKHSAYNTLMFLKDSMIRQKEILANPYRSFTDLLNSEEIPPEYRDVIENHKLLSTVNTLISLKEPVSHNERYLKYFSSPNDIRKIDEKIKNDKKNTKDETKDDTKDDTKYDTKDLIKYEPKDDTPYYETLEEEMHSLNLEDDYVEAMKNNFIKGLFMLTGFFTTVKSITLLKNKIINVEYPDGEFELLPFKNLGNTFYKTKDESIESDQVQLITNTSPNESSTARPVLTEDKRNELKDMFPMFTSDIINLALEMNDGDIEETKLFLSKKVPESQKNPNSGGKSLVRKSNKNKKMATMKKSKKIIRKRKTKKRKNKSKKRK